VELEDESLNSLMREGREERGEGGGAEGGVEEGEVRSMTSHGFVHSSLGITDTLAHVHFGLGSTGPMELLHTSTSCCSGHGTCSTLPVWLPSPLSLWGS